MASLLERGEERLVAAVEAGVLPLRLALVIATADEEGAQVVLAEAYRQKKLRGKRFVAARRILQLRRRFGGRLPGSRSGRSVNRPPTSEVLASVYQQEIDNQRIMIKKVGVALGHLSFVIEAFQVLREDEYFMTLLRAEGLATMPSFLQEHLAKGNCHGG